MPVNHHARNETNTRRQSKLMADTANERIPRADRAFAIVLEDGGSFFRCWTVVIANFSEGWGIFYLCWAQRKFPSQHLKSGIIRKIAAFPKIGNLHLDAAYDAQCS
jgi:hypothetical protein